MKSTAWKTFFHYIWRILFVALLNFMVLVMLAR